MDEKTRKIYGTAYAGMYYRKELKQVRVKEADYLIKKHKHSTSYFEDMLDDKIPDGLKDKLEKAFAEAFSFIFSKGADYIKLTYSQDKIENAKDKEQEAKKRLYKDLGLTFTEGTGMGVLGIGLPDIVVFISVLLRNIYQTSELYGYKCESKAEQIYVLKLIEAALIRGKDAEIINDECDSLSAKIDNEDYVYYGLIDEQIQRTAIALAEDMLYMKFVQTIPVVGAVGGIKNVRCLKKVGEYAEIKYHKRYLMRIIREREEIKEE